jgi:hypothetical protein
MSQSSPLIVRIERSGKPFGSVMNEIRSWLDSHKIQPAAFKTDTMASGPVAFEIKFQREDEAQLFERAFT